MLGMKKEVFAVTGMTCGHCEARVTDALSQLEGVARAKADAAQDRVEVTLTRGAQLDRDRLADAIRGAGFEVEASS